MITDTQITIGEIVAEDFRTASVFSKYGIDFCCKGHRTLEEACQKKKLPTEELLEVLNQASISSTAHTFDYASWPSDMLTDYIELRHHKYIEEKTPVLLQLLDEICRVHGSTHPELFKVNELFMLSATDLSEHMQKEEQILFPFIRQMIQSIEEDKPFPVPQFDTVENPIALMKADHSTEGELFEAIAEITYGFTPPADACSTYKVTFAMLKEFQEDLHIHIHLENNILFPTTIALEKEFGG